MKYHKDGSQPNQNQVFAFGSNLSGIHGAGAAKAAMMHYGAIYGVGQGPMGMSYALPTVKFNIAGPLPLEEIKNCINQFIEHAEAHPAQEFMVTRVGCVLAGYKDSDIAPMFTGAPENCSMPDTWKPFLG